MFKMLEDCVVLFVNEGCIVRRPLSLFAPSGDSEIDDRELASEYVRQEKCL